MSAYLVFGLTSFRRSLGWGLEHAWTKIRPLAARKAIRCSFFRQKIAWEVLQSVRQPPSSSLVASPASLQVWCLWLGRSYWRADDRWSQSTDSNRSRAQSAQSGRQTSWPRRAHCSITKCSGHTQQSIRRVDYPLSAGKITLHLQAWLWASASV